ncbi:hypothetical protein HY212_02955 [Candidatus Pacearchaeota archaeon]|nr:hypothetical protein [Candidatus Pacearchaeota archaeon]
MKTQFLPIDYDSFDYEGRNYILIIGRSEKGKRIAIVDTCPIYFWAILEKDVKEKKVKELITKISKIKLDVKGRKTYVEKVEVNDKNFLGNPVKALKIYASNYKDLHDIAGRIDMPEIIKRRGYDLGFITHYIIEKKLKPLIWYEAEGEEISNSLEFGGIGKSLNVDHVLKLEKHKEFKEIEFKPKTLTYDIETDDFKIGEGEILMISLYSENFKKVISWKGAGGRGVGGGKEKLDYVEYVKDEADLLEKFTEYVKKLSPDFLVGYFSDGFDLPYLKARAEKNKVKLSLGLDESQPSFQRGAMATGKVKGIVHIDLLRFIQTAYSQYMQSETLSLNEVSKEFLGDEKKSFAFKHSSKIKDNEWDEFFEYNLHDSYLVYNLFQKFWPDITEFSRIMQEPVFDVTRNGMAKNVEDFIIHNLEKYNEIPEKRPLHNEIGERRSKPPFEGAFVYEPIPGLYEDVAVFDFTSSYGSTIVTFNLSKSTLLDKNSKDAYNIEALGKKIYFSKKPGFFPEMLKEIIKKRKQFKEELKKEDDNVKRATSNAFKLLANASYGYQSFYGGRYYSEEAGAATAAFARKAIKDAIDNINKAGFKVIYSDTDSIAFLMNKKSKAETNEFLKELNKNMPGIMELELEGFFKRGLWVSKRSGDIGAKKKYALIDEKGRLKIRGFETVRRDWCKLARQVQNQVLKYVLEDGNEKRALDYIKEVIKKIKDRKYEISDLTVKTQLRKPISEYKAITPHVIAAKKMLERKIPLGFGSLIEYYVSESKEKKALVRDRVKLVDEKGEYDIKYYLESQILPAVENIMQVLSVDVNELIEGRKQKTLGDF